MLGAPVGLRHADSAEGNPGVAETGAAGLLDNGADVIVGPLSSATAASVLEQVAGRDALLVSPAATSTGLDALDRTGRLFRTGPTEVLQGRALADLLVSDGHRTVAVAARADDYGEAIADALAERLAAADASVVARADYDPSAPDLGEDVVERLDTQADAVVLVGLAETALVARRTRRRRRSAPGRPVYGTDGNLGERLGDLVDDRCALACFRGLLPVDEPAADFAERVRSHAPALDDLDAAGLDLAAESYDATVVAALAAASAGSDSGSAMAAAMAGVTTGETPCRDPQACLDLIATGTDISYVGQTGRLALDAEGNRTAAGFTIVAFDADGHLTRLGEHRVPPPDPETGRSPRRTPDPGPDRYSLPPCW